MNLYDLLSAMFPTTNVTIVNMSGIGAARILCEHWTAAEALEELCAGLYEVDDHDGIGIDDESGDILLFVSEPDEYDD